ncbi:hypothetical protein NLG97_g17 [Lecanicillium saksenae]|uniref:Uncharacterized protein n=1 Tax=Lecanicillium saksenae TaxID=468837 RepID=A0ACC1RB84_9HYPO|nr:hypothetical protein NLG97_g17 [Lecanicillium saksenae]
METDSKHALSVEHDAPFPEDIQTAPLLQISLAKLLEHDVKEIQRFTQACETLGFFYLDLRGPGDTILAQSNELFNVGQSLLSLPLEEKKKYDFEHLNTYFGYKKMGGTAIDQTGTLDRNEFYNVSKDDIFDISKRWPAPTVLESNRSLLKSFITEAHSIVTLLLEILNKYLELPDGTLPSMHRLHLPGGDQVRFIKAPPQPKDDRQTALGEHTDFGSITVLFNRLGGLQVLPPGRDSEWCYVKPLAGHAIINLGDALVKFTNGLLRSNIHRVVAPPGAQASHTRYSLVYFNRPEDSVFLRRLDYGEKIPPLAKGEPEEEICSKDWILRRALGSRPHLSDTGAFDLSKSRGTETLSQRLGRD